MRTNIVLNDELIKKAFRHSSARTKKELVHEALEELISARQRLTLLHNDADFDRMRKVAPLKIYG